jgi:diguanylate cyclase (GGDEF)-like protein
MNSNNGDQAAADHSGGGCGSGCGSGHGAGHAQRAAGQVGDMLLAERERKVAAREQLISSRERAVAKADEQMRQRERALARRHRQVAEQDLTLAEAARVKRMLESDVAKLRQANAHLVIATLGAQVMSEEMARARDDMGHRARHDFLTNLPNRVLLMERMTQAIAMAKRQGARMAVLFIDLDRFKSVNDTLGHAMGDLLLQAVAQRLLSVVRTTDTASRQGGDEFIVLLAEVADERSVAELAEQLRRTLAEPYLLGGDSADIGGTIGISMYPDDGEDAETLIRNADVAMYHGKHSGGNRCYFYRPEMNLRAVERQRVEADLRRALRSGEFELRYQPRIDVASGGIAGAEAVLRWLHPEQGMLAPSRFIPAAEECGLIVDIGRWALREACLQAARWQQQGLDPGVIAVNVSTLEFRNPGFAGQLRAILSESGLAPHNLGLEFTEDVLRRDAGASAAILRELKDIGVMLAIDDFGTGYSSLSQLNRLPIDVLKIDRSFIEGIHAAPGDSAIAAAVIAMARSLGQRVVAEGVGQPAQLDFLRAHRCDEAQGYLFSRPLTAPGFAALLAPGKPAASRATTTDIG